MAGNGSSSFWEDDSLLMISSQIGASSDFLSAVAFNLKQKSFWSCSRIWSSLKRDQLVEKILQTSTSAPCVALWSLKFSSSKDSIRQVLPAFSVPTTTILTLEGLAFPSFKANEYASFSLESSNRASVKYTKV